MRAEKFSIGEKVHYIPFEGCGKKAYQNGIVKSLNEYDSSTVFVVFHCNNEWDDFANYTGQSTKKEQLRKGWFEYTPMSKERIQEFANDILMLVPILDLLNIRYASDELDELVENMHSSNSHLAAFPFPETMRKAEIMTAQTRTLAALVELLRIRKEQLDVQRKPDDTTGNIILKQLGFE